MGDSLVTAVSFVRLLNMLLFLYPTMRSCPTILPQLTWFGESMSAGGGSMADGSAGKKKLMRTHALRSRRGFANATASRGTYKARKETRHHTKIVT